MTNNNEFKYGCCPNDSLATGVLKCLTCHKEFHYSCISTSKTPYVELSNMFKASWICPTCIGKQPKTDNSNTPVRNVTSFQFSADESSSNVTHRKKRFNPNEAKADVTSVSHMHEAMREEMASLLDDFKSTMMHMFEQKTNEIFDLLIRVQSNVNNLNKKYDELKNEFSNKYDTFSELEAENYSLRDTVTDLSTRLTQMEQHSRSSNVEIQCIPEHKAENLVCTIKQIAATTKFNFNENDIHLCTRTARVNKESTRPRSVIVKFSCPRIRDGFLAAAKNFNKNAKSPSEKLNSGHLGIAGDRRPVYVVEHLSPAMKALHAAARVKSKELGYKFVWVSQGQIFIRKTEISTYILVRNQDTLAKLQ